MNKHKKLAIIIAPFLAIGGYIATDFYDSHQKNKKRYHNITVQGDCNIVHGPCLLQGAGLTLEFTINGEQTNIESNYPLETAAIGIKDAEVDKPYNLTPNTDRKNWTIDTSAYNQSKTPHSATVRLIVTSKGHSFFSEFTNTQ